MNILFVCTGNTCRSPMAAALLKNKRPAYHVKSAGIFANENLEPNRHAVRALYQYDIQLSHQSTQITEKLLNWADLVLTMTTNHVQTLIMEYPQFQEKYYTLKEFALGADNKVWKELQGAYGRIQEKQTNIIQKYQLQLDQHELKERMLQECEEDVLKIRQLESEMVDYNISDPFGGSLEVYEETLAELNRYIDQTIEKIETD